VSAKLDNIPHHAFTHASDEHDIKLAYSARAQSRAWNDPVYEWCADRYLAPRLSRAP
jgi:hypothetical protein